MRLLAAALAAAALLPLARCGPQDFKLVSVDAADSQARCNDGSRAGFYYAPATSDASVWLVMLEGGEWCYDEASCAERAATNPGFLSSTHWKDTYSLGGIFETDDTKTPFAGAHKVYVPYCSSDAWVGATVAAGLQFNGQAIVAGVLQTLVAKQGMGAQPGHRLLFGGCSAGARGAMFNLDYVPAILAAAGAKDIQVQGLLDSPLWIDVAPLASAPLSLQCQTQAAVGFLNASARLGDACAAAYGAESAESWRCLFGEYRLPFLTTPYGLNAAQYDTFQLEYALGGTEPPKYPDQITYADSFGEAMLAVVSALPAAGQAGSAVFSSACFHHCVTLTESFWGIQSEGVSFSQALRWWLFGGCPPEDCPDGEPSQVIEHCDEGFEACKGKCTLKRSSKGGKHKRRYKSTFVWSPGMATPPAPVQPLACAAGPQPQQLQS